MIDEPFDEQAFRAAGEHFPYGAKWRAPLDRVSEWEDDERTTMFAPDEVAGVAMCVEAIRQLGARSVRIEYEAPLLGSWADGRPPPADLPVVWVARAEWRDGREPAVGRWGPTTDHHAGPVSACAELLRSLGASVSILDARPGRPL